MKQRCSEFSDFRGSDKSLNHIYWDQFKDLVSHPCLVRTGVASWSLTQEMTGSNPFTIMTNILVTEFSEFNESLRENSSSTTNCLLKQCILEDKTLLFIVLWF